MAGPAPVLVRFKNGADAFAKVLTDFKEVHMHTRTNRILNLQIIAIKIVISLQGLNDEEIN